MKLVWRPSGPALSRLLPSYERTDYSYDEVGATQLPWLPPEYDHVVRSTVLSTQPSAFDRAVRALMSWDMHRRAGLTVVASQPRAEVGVTSVMTFGSRFAGVLIPCRVVWSLHEPDRRGFAYGTLAGHPERGEEAFVVERTGDGVVLSIRAFSVPGNPVVRAAAPLARYLQSRMTERYAQSLTELARLNGS